MVSHFSLTVNVHLHSGKKKRLGYKHILLLSYHPNYQYCCFKCRCHFCSWYGCDHNSGADLGEGCKECAPPEMTCCFLIQLVLCPKKNKRKKLGGVTLPKKNPEPTTAATCNTTETSTTTDTACTTNSVAVRCVL